ncbi:MAG: glutathione S-transferase family protein [Parvibaculum sp.]|uniref:glutathione S-transferase family protein n=1 Tax=Parvibaculum sp. TaxID=2024848 RepID=UPI002727CF37|nr:glutathione S-transferase family protein [Parvibaculum sp.]MDO8840394.1 glutathione S-transferase family protein [Parvibaculum sp.]
MKFYNSIGPNPRVVKMFMQEKGIKLPFVEVDLMAGENRKEPYLAKNPSGQSPALELDDGTVLAEITAICEYLDEKFPGNSLIGSTPEERAETRMWTRRVDLNICEPMANGFRFAEGLPLFQNRMRCLPEAAAGLKAIAQDKLAWLDKLMSGREFLAGKRLTMADILLFGFLDFGASVGQPIDPEFKNISAWFERMKARPSAAASA